MTTQPDETEPEPKGAPGRPLGPIPPAEPANDPAQDPELVPQTGPTEE